MKKVFLFFLMMLPVAVMGQKDVTTFLGIPVDGTKAEMVQKLKAKGFSYDIKTKMLTGSFNGNESMIAIGENNGKVWRICVIEKVPRTESQIRIAFNNLTSQFEQNNRYIPYSDNIHLEDSEQIGYGIRLYHKEYANCFFQKNNEGVPDNKKKVWFCIKELEYLEYVLVIYYDNEYNMANGEDL